MTDLSFPAHDILQDEYNAVPYQSYAFPQTHPVHLATLAKLFGVNTAPVENARVLELGCASGGNILPMAYRLPKAQFIGIDLAEKQIAEGQATIAKLNLSNIQLRHQSILDFNDAEKFDYIICHGVYSWVDEPVRQKILSICREKLSHHGIAYISYNTFPGWNMINSIRELMLWHTQKITNPTQKAQQARSILKFLVDGLQQDTSAYAQVLRNEVNLLSKQADSYLLHEHLSTYNSPIYFHQFMEKANKADLAYLADAFLATMFTENLPPAFATELKKINNIVIAGQYMDFIRNQRFRATLLCHKEVLINRALKTADIASFHLQLQAKADKPDFSANDIGKTELKISNNHLTLSVRNPLSQLALMILLQEQARPIHYNELCEKIQALKPEYSTETIVQHLNNDLNLLRMTFGGLVQITTYPGEYITQVEEKPLACPFARFQAQHQHWLTNRRHQIVYLDPILKILVPLLDGTHDIPQLMGQVQQGLVQSQLNLLDENKQPIKDLEKIKPYLRGICEKALQQLTKQAVLIKATT